MNRLHKKDSILDGFSFEDLIDTVHCNESKINEKAVKKVFEEMLQYQIAEAREMFEAQLKNVMKELR